MKKILDKLKQQFHLNRKMLLFFMVIVLVGIIAGSIFVTILDKSDKAIVKEYFEQFITNIDKNRLDYLFAFKSSSIGNLFTMFLIWVVGFSIIGIPIILFLLFSKAFIIGFTVGSVILNYQWKGILLSFITVFPHQILSILVIGILSIYSVSLSIKLFYAIFKKKQIDFKHITNRYLLVFGVCCGVILLCSCYEVFAVPNLIKLILPILK